MPNVSPLALVDPLTGDLTAPRLRAVPSPLPAASLASLVAPLSLTSPGAAGIYRLPDAAPDASLVGYLVLVPVGTELDVTAVPARVAPPAAPVVPAAAVSAPEATAAPEAPEAAAVVEAAPGVSLDLERRTVRIDGEPLELTYLEFELLAHLTRNPHRVHTRDHLVSAVWGYGHVGDGRTVDVHVARLRRKLGRHREGIVTVRRVGYKYVPASAR
ncbi:winged helix-turn-helix domain-containing protein [Streptacidiphilus sp. P02-A3a]|uniref:winged helix-turn-helix domain-containing protein n=1 Tax=Streptacidiphilus sp. P02-A3a TaxID=2704468 RepID=UPI0015FE56F7|nr:winged helix-turn-helix domain-containing protein [Streptacidiphilus sp. P02-A3a]QMU68846.1 winged helix-turn-helix transcriptional regulator [Streptacidiphilus sp. P02-A3a]